MLRLCVDETVCDETVCDADEPDADWMIDAPLCGSAATAEDHTAIATIQSATTFSDQPIKYLFKTEGAGGQVIKMVLLYVTEGK